MQVCERQINAAALKVLPRILPKVGELKRSRQPVGEGEKLGIPVPKKLQHQSPDGVRRIGTIIQDGDELRMAAHTNIHFKGAEQVFKMLAAEAVLSGSVRKGDKNRMRGFTFVATNQPLPPGSERGEPSLRGPSRLGFVGIIVRNPSKSVNGSKGVPSGAVSMITGSAPAVAVARIRARGLRPCARA